MPSTPSAAYLCQEEIARQPIGVSDGVCAAAVAVCVQPRRKLPAAAAAACGSTAPVPRLPLRRISCKRSNQHINDKRDQVDKHRIAILGILQAFRHLIPLVLVVGDRLRGVIRGATSCSVVSADHHYWRSLWTMSLHYPSILHSISK